MKGGQNEMTFGRYFLSFFGNKLIKFLLKIESDEFTTSYRGFDLKNLKAVAVAEIGKQAGGIAFWKMTN